MGERKPTRLHNYDYSSPGAYFVTICTHRKANLFGKITDGQVCLNQSGQIAALWWRLLPYRYQRISLDEFIVMPDHIHGILRIGNTPSVDVGEIHEFPLRSANSANPSNQESSDTFDFRIARRRMLLPMAIGYFKMNTAKAINKFRKTSDRRVWQRSYYEHIIRGDRDLDKVRRYISNNPIAQDLDDSAFLD